MKPIRWAAIALLILTLSACKRETSWHQRLTITLETPIGEVTGSSVISVEARYFGQSIGNEVEYDVTGEAVVVKVLPGKYLFALMGEPSELYHSAAREVFAGQDRGEWLFEIPRQTDLVSLVPDHVPMLVTFDDLSKPETVKLVDPNDLATSFGPGVRLKSVTLEITDEPMTKGRVGAVLSDDFFARWASLHQVELAKDRPNNNPYFQSLTARMGPENFYTGKMK